MPSEPVPAPEIIDRTAAGWTVVAVCIDEHAPLDHHRCLWNAGDISSR